MGRRVLAAFALLLALPGAAPPPPKADADRIRADVAFLASDHLRGRAPGTVGHALAADHVLRRLVG